VVRVGILGSRFRYWGDEKFLLNCVKSLLMNELKRRYRNGFEIIVGDEVTGVDRVVYELCRKLNIPVTVVKRECNEPKCLVARTRKVVELSDIVYAVFPEEEFISRGTTYGAIYSYLIKKPTYLWVCFRDGCSSLRVINAVTKLPNNVYLVKTDDPDSLKCRYNVYLIHFGLKSYRPIKIVDMCFPAAISDEEYT